MTKRTSGQKRHQKTLKRKKKRAKKSTQTVSLSEGMPGIAENLAEFAQPLLGQFASTREGVEVAFALASNCWNIGIATATEADSMREEVIDVIKNKAPASVNLDEFDDMVDSQILGRRVFYRDDFRTILDYKLDWYDDDYRIQAKGKALPVQYRNTLVGEDMLAGLSRQGREKMKEEINLASAPLSDQESVLVDHIKAGYDLIEDAQLKDISLDYPRLCETWLSAWEQVRTLYTDSAAIESIRSFYPLYDIHLPQWVDDLEVQLHNAGLTTQDLDYFKKRLVLCQEICTSFPESNPLLIHSFRRAEAESWFFIGQIDQGEAAFEALVKDFPDNAWGYIGWGDMYSDNWLGGELLTCDYEKAKALYEIPIKRELEDAEEAQIRLKDLEQYLQENKGTFEA